MSNFADALDELVDAAERYGNNSNLGAAQYETQQRENVEARVKVLVEAHLRLLDICTFATPSLIYKFLGDDAAVAAGLPLWPEHYSGDPSMQLDLSWAEAAAMPFKEADDAL